MSVIIYVDGYCFTNPGPCGCRGVMDGKEIFRYDLGHGTNNVGEFYAIAAGIKYAKDNNLSDVIIYSDSNTALTWIESKWVNSQSKNPNLIKASKYIRNTDFSSISIRKWDTRKHGQIPADFGHKK